jgi:hypothetical protein
VVVLAVLVGLLVQAAVTAAVAAAAVVLAGLQPKVLLAGQVLQFPVKTLPGVEADQRPSEQRQLRCSQETAEPVLQQALPARLCHTEVAEVAGVRI